MNYHNITKDDMNNGDGIRVVLWVAGCEHHCPECHNPETWCYNSGIPFDYSALKELREELRKDYVSGITISGGDPFAPENRRATTGIVHWVRENFPSKTIWIYTGYTYEELIGIGIVDPHIWCVLLEFDVLVDGKYNKDLRDTSLKWRGSSNQRVIDMKKSLSRMEVVLHCD